MDFAYSPKVQALRERVMAFMEEHVYPAEAIFEQQVNEGDRWQPTAIMEELKAKAKAQGLWNLFLPESELGAGLTNTEYAPLAEIMGSSLIGAEPFNCSAPDTGNMEVWCATPTRRRSSSGWCRCSTARSAPPLP